MKFSCARPWLFPTSHLRPCPLLVDTLQLSDREELKLSRAKGKGKLWKISCCTRSCVDIHSRIHQFQMTRLATSTQHVSITPLDNVFFLIKHTQLEINIDNFLVFSTSRIARKLSILISSWRCSTLVVLSTSSYWRGTELKTPRAPLNQGLLVRASIGHILPTTICCCHKLLSHMCVLTMLLTFLPN